MKNTSKAEIIYFNMHQKDRTIINDEFNLNNDLTIVTTRKDTYIIDILKKCKSTDIVIIDGINYLSHLIEPIFNIATINNFKLEVC